MLNVENYLSDLADAGWQFPKNKEDNPFVGEYEPEMDDNPALEHDL